MVFIRKRQFKRLKLHFIHYFVVEKQHSVDLLQTNVDSLLVYLMLS